MKKGIVFFLLIFMLLSCQNVNNPNDILKDTPIDTSELVETTDIVELSTIDNGVKKTIEQYFEKDITRLTDEDYKEMSQFNYLVVENTVSSVDDIVKFFPNIKYLDINVDTLSPELYKSIKNLRSLKALTLYCNSITVTEFDNDFEYFEIAYSNDDNLPYKNVLSKVCISDETLLSEYLQGNIKKIARIKNNDGITYELIVTDYYTEGELWETQERFIFVYENDSFIFKEALDASAEMGAVPQNSLQLIDINFDGILDILVDNGHFGTQGFVTYTCFINDNGNYIKCDSFSNIPNPSIDTENKKILSTWRNWAASHSWAIFTLQNNEFVMTDCLTEAEDLNENAWIYTIEKLIDDKLQETEKFTTNDYSYEEIHNMVYDKNSYWGLLSEKWNTLYNQGSMIGFSIYGSNKINGTIQRIIDTYKEVDLPTGLQEQVS